MRVSRHLLLVLALLSLATLPMCAGDDNSFTSKVECSDGKDNDGDGMIDFPDDLGCVGHDDDSEGDPPSPQCKDGRDNDGDGKIDYPYDPGCFAPQQDSEDDDCPDGPNCPQCGNGIDDDMNGLTDFPSDAAGCTSASDIDEYTQNPAACGSNKMIKKLPFDGRATGMLMAGAASGLMSPECGGSGTEDVYEIRINVPKVVVASTANDGTTADTVLYLRSADCQNNASELACNDNVSTTIKASTLTVPISTKGTYYLVVDAKDALGGAYDLSVKFFVGEGTECMGADDCGPSLVCRVPKGETKKVCSKHVCEDGIDDDDDGKIDYPNDPGCLTPKDDDESDNCPSGAGCPECGDGIDNDGDTLIDYGPGGDPTCKAASDSSEACVTSEGVTTITTAVTMGNTMGAVNDSKPTCASTSSTAMAPDLMYRLDLPTMTALSLNTVGFDTATALYNSTCTGTAIACSDPPLMNVGAIAAGTYYFLVDGWSSGSGAFTITVSGTIANNASCESPLAQAGAISCALGYACQGTMGSRTCQPAVCSDGLDNDNDMKIDYPFDPGCASPAGTSEVDPVPPPVCANGIDDDGDGQTDYPNDWGCAAASGTTEVFCAGEMDPTSRITQRVTTGTTAGLSNDWAPTSTCAFSSAAPDAAFSLQLPVAVTTLQVDTLGSAFDTVLMVRSLDCATQLFCNDQDGALNTSKIVMNGVSPGGYAIVVDGWSALNGAFTLNVFGTVAAGARCDSPLFTGGTNAVLSCPTGTTCTGTPIPKCQ
jgi:large repetitive protein